MFIILTDSRIYELVVISFVKQATEHKILSVLLSVELFYLPLFILKFFANVPTKKLRYFVIINLSINSGTLLTFPVCKA